MELIDSIKIEEETRKKYDGGIYKVENIYSIPKTDTENYTEILLLLKLNLVKNHLSDLPILDLCCGPGINLLSLANDIKTGIGLDFSRSFIEKANQIKEQQNIHNITFIEGNARQLPFKDNSFGCVYSLSALYYIPQINQVIDKISRVLSKGGKCIIELGNLFSLNTIVGRAYPELAYLCDIPVKQMKELLEKADLKIIEHKAFQILPLWAVKPKWLYPLLNPWWTKIFAKKIKGKMLDEWISNMLLLKNFAFRHIFVCIKHDNTK